MIEAETLALYGFRPNALTTTMVVTGQTCASACVLLLMSGKRKVVFGGARAGVHSVAEGGGAESRITRGFTTELARTLADRGVAADVIGQLVTTTPNEIHWLTADELRRSGVTIMPDLRSSGPLPSKAASDRQTPSVPLKEITRPPAVAGFAPH
jgi:hypothetical protein